MRGCGRRALVASLVLALVGCRSRLPLGDDDVDPVEDGPEPAEFCRPDLPTEGGAPLGRAVDQIAVGDYFSCARAGGEVFCWGANVEGHLGDGTLTSRARPSRVKLEGALDIGSGSGLEVCFSPPPSKEHFGSRGSNSCAVLADGRVSCWGTNVGFDDTPLAAHPAPVPVVVEGLSNATQVSVSQFHACARLADGTARCWGRRTFDLGDGGGFAPGTVGPVRVKKLSTVRQVIAEAAHSCALLEDGTVACWGFNEDGELGDGTIVDRQEPVAVVELRDVVSIGGRMVSTCAVRKDRTVWCWGRKVDLHGLLGVQNVRQPKPVRVEGLDPATQVAVDYDYGCAALVDGGVACWGKDQFVHYDTRPAPMPHPPARIEGLADIVEVQVANDHACARDRSGRMWCWGSNFAGELGDGTTVRHDRPVRVR